MNDKIPQYVMGNPEMEKKRNFLWDRRGQILDRLKPIVKEIVDSGILMKENAVEVTFKVVVKDSLIGEAASFMKFPDWDGPTPKRIHVEEVTFKVRYCF